MSKSLAVIVLAAGQGTRMKSDKAKVLHEVGGRPMIAHVLDQVAPLRPAKAVCVIGHQADAVREAVEADPPKYEVDFAVQKQRLGTGHAVAQTKAALRGFDGPVLILSGDVPLLRPETIKRALAEHNKGKYTLTALSFFAGDPTGYGRILRDASGDFCGIVEHRDATPEQRDIDEVNGGIYLVDAKTLFRLLGKVQNDNDQGEYYLTDIVGLAQGEGLRLSAVPLEDEAEAMGVNSRVELAQAEAVLRERILLRHMRAGVTIVDPSATYVDAHTAIGADTVLHPGATLRGRCKIGAECVIENGAILTDCVLGAGVHVEPYAVLENVRLKPGETVEAFLRLKNPAALAKVSRKAVKSGKRRVSRARR
ncbi:MAG: bifunctional N-acetylglucosamine-1-phosphate uridyltransferase/glucosamine-1-phosphate acetyltransferase [Deltaproteobacteria bacterium]|nr:bifunctional N-acetylglucosamine-1-phosphate uridyltransferase/glucosamine-1-phosphate acetyltransferase [Deltaproteobacteria bacterium]MCB9490309.1 bifunctional N-acetylglucosamine-1-phosphate uridyltransferase/glucosamine-1-phosphate acetyltransferase [Deltaproteobacteria bacterium]